MFEFLIQEFNKRDTTKKNWKLMIFTALSFLYGISPGIIRVMYNQTFHGDIAREIIGFYLNSISMAFLMMSAIMFSISAKIDMKRRSFILRQLGQMISCQKIESYKEPKLLPTINITDQLSLNTWLDLRKLAVDYGRKYFRRHEIFTPVLFILGVFSFVAFFVMLVISTDGMTEFARTEIGKSRLLLVLNSIVMFYLFFGLLYQGAGINYEFSEHQQILRKNK